MKPTTAPTATPDQALLPTDQLGAETAATARTRAPQERAAQHAAARVILELPDGLTPTYTDTPGPTGYSVAVRANTSGIRLADPPSISTRTREDLLHAIAEHGVAVERATWRPSLIEPSAPSPSSQSATANPPTLATILSAAPKTRR